MKVTSATRDDLPSVLALLRAAELPLDGVEDHFEAFLVVRDDGGGLVGCIGAEVYEEVGLLRSLAVARGSRGSGLGQRLVEALVARSRERGLRTLYLLTTTAERYFPRFGFDALPRREADPRLEASPELRGACPDSAILMRLAL